MSLLGNLVADISALIDTGNSGPDVGKGNTGFNAVEVGRMTNSTTKDAVRAGHEARNDMAKQGGWGIPSNRHDQGNQKGK